jgi:hypothetical protein
LARLLQGAITPEEMRPDLFGEELLPVLAGKPRGLGPGCHAAGEAREARAQAQT